MAVPCHSSDPYLVRHSTCLNEPNLTYFRAILVWIDQLFFTLRFKETSGNWIHIVLNYITPEQRHPQIHYNGKKLRDGFLTVDPKEDVHFTSSDGTVSLGKFRNRFTSVVMDELMFFNEKLREDEIKELYEQGLHRL